MLITILSLLIFKTTHQSFAAESDVIISEIMMNAACGGTDTNICNSSSSSDIRFEWVEIYNKGTSPVDLSNWQICDEAACDTLLGTTTINPGEYMIIVVESPDDPSASPALDSLDGLNTELAACCGSAAIASQTIFVDGTIGSGGLSQSGDAVYLITDEADCGAPPVPCVSDCVSWDATNTCASLVDGFSLAYEVGSDGTDDVTLTTNEQNGQSISNVDGNWGQSGPADNTANQGSPYAQNQHEPTYIELVSFNATETESGVLVEWETSFEFDHAGFNILRRAQGRENWAQVNTSLIASRGLALKGASYDFLDDAVSAGQWEYALEDVNLLGDTTQHAPVSIDFRAPTAVALGTNSAVIRPAAGLATLFSTVTLLCITWLAGKSRGRSQSVKRETNRVHNQPKTSSSFIENSTPTYTRPSIEKYTALEIQNQLASAATGSGVGGIGDPDRSLFDLDDGN